MSNAVERIQAYLEELSTRNTLDQDVIQNLRPEAVGEISLRVADLKDMLTLHEGLQSLSMELKKQHLPGYQRDWERGYDAGLQDAGAILTKLLTIAGETK